MFLSNPGKRNFLIFQEVTFRLLFCCFFIRYFVLVLLYRKCYGFERGFFTFRRFLCYTPSPIRHSIASTTDLRELSLSSDVFKLTFFKKIWHKLLLSTMKDAGPPTEVRNTDPAHIFV